MKTRLLWIAIAAVGLTALYFGLVRPQVSTIPRDVREAVSDLKPTVPPLEPPVVLIPPTPAIALPPLKSPPRIDPIPGPPEVPIQNGTTLDFSTGSPILKMGGKDQDALEAALKEMTEAAKNTSIEIRK